MAKTVSDSPKVGQQFCENGNFQEQSSNTPWYAFHESCGRKSSTSTSSDKSNDTISYDKYSKSSDSEPSDPLAAPTQKEKVQNSKTFHKSINKNSSEDVVRQLKLRKVRKRGSQDIQNKSHQVKGCDWHRTFRVVLARIRKNAIQKNLTKDPSDPDKA